MRIAFVSYEFPPETPPGGIGTYTAQTAGLLAAAGYEVHVFAGSHQKPGCQKKGEVMVHRVCCENPHDFQKKILPVFAAEHERQPFDLVESAEIHGNAWEIKKRYPHLPLVVRLHAGNHLVESLKKKYYPLSAKLRYVVGALRQGRLDAGYWRRYQFRNDPDYQFACMADHLTAPSEQMKAWAVRQWQIHPDCITAIQNLFLPGIAWQGARTENKEQTVLFYGRLSVLKGLVTATQAMKKILGANPSWTWVIAGDDGLAPAGRGSMKAWMEEKLAPVATQVTFRDAVNHEDLPNLLRKASIVLVPSLFESFSYVTLEAMYAGKAVIGSRETAIAALIQQKRNGMLAGTYKIREWVKSIQQLIDDPGLRKELGRQAIAAAEKRARGKEELIDWYLKMQNQKKPQPCA